MIREELDRLPDSYRQPVTLCYMEGLTHQEAASRLGWPVGTVKVRLVRGRRLLRERLDRRGAGLGGGLLLWLLNPSQAPAVPQSLAGINRAGNDPGSSGPSSSPRIEVRRRVANGRGGGGRRDRPEGSLELAGRRSGSDHVGFDWLRRARLSTARRRRRSTRQRCQPI